MKHSLRIPFAVVFFLAVYVVIINFPGGILSPDDPDRETRQLLSLAAEDPGEVVFRRDVDDLLLGSIPGSVAGRRSRVSLSYKNLEESRKELLLRPEIRQSLRDWKRSRSFEPSVITKVAEQLFGGRTLGRCAVVGNSGILYNAEHGDAIDAHDTVIRLNLAPVAGYQRHVGSKTTLSFVNSNVVFLCRRRSATCACLHPYDTSVRVLLYICQAVQLLDFNLCNSSAADAGRAPLAATDPRLDVLLNRIAKFYSLRRFVAATGRPASDWPSAHDEAMFHYSSGMEAVVVAAAACDEVSLYGFGKAAGARHHYHTRQKSELDLHDFEAEYEFYRDLAERPKEIPYIGSDDIGFVVPRITFHH